MIAQYLENLHVREETDSPSLRLEKYADATPLAKSGEIDAVITAFGKTRNINREYLFQHEKAEAIALKLRGRMIINQAGGILENSGLCLHRHLGLPYIPGSAVKGVARHYAWELWNAATGEDRRELAEKIAVSFGFPTGEDDLDKELRQINPAKYGKNEAAYSGNIAFLGGVPEARPALVKDIVTSHHQKYYAKEPEYMSKNKGMALDNESPIPVPFLAVENGTKFVFQLLPLNAEADVEWMKKMLADALRYNGVGAKTSAGYGWFDDGLSKRDRENQEKLAANEAEKRARHEAEEMAKEEERRLQAEKVEMLRREEEEKQRKLNEKRRAKGFDGLDKAGWQSFRKNVEKRFGVPKVALSQEDQLTLENIIVHNEKLKLEDLEKARNFLLQCFGGDETVVQRILEAKGGRK